MAEKALKELKIVKKYVVNHGRPNEAYYDSVKKLTTIGDTTFYKVQVGDKFGIIDQYGGTRLPLICKSIDAVVATRLGGELYHFVICVPNRKHQKNKQDGFLRSHVLLMENPWTSATVDDPKEMIKVHYTPHDDLIFRTDHCPIYPIILEDKRDDVFIPLLNRPLVDYRLEPGYELDYLYNVARVLGRYTCTRHAFWIIYDRNGSIVYEGSDTGAPGDTTIIRYQDKEEGHGKAENAFIILFNGNASLLLFPPRKTGASTCVSLPKDAGYDGWTKFMKENGYFGKIIWQQPESEQS